ncbi:MAG: hypothetical protein KA369_11760 [Spirochaetes bacterium]|nr:hypothetical protein [Spirochaetota bacterium]
MKELSIRLLVVSLLLLGLALPVRGDDGAESPPNASFGFAGSYGWYRNWERKGGDMIMKYDFTTGYGGGLVFEKMFNNTLGIHSGLWFNNIELIYRLKTPITSANIDLMSLYYTKLNIKGWTISLPLSLVTSLNASIFSFQIHTGIKYTHIVTSEMTHNNPVLKIYKKKMDMLSLINQSQFGITVGLFFRFRTAPFVDLFFGAEGELYVTELLRTNSNLAHLFGLTGQAGMMFRTNIFPIPATAGQASL